MMKYKGIDKEKILEVQKVKLPNTDAYAIFTEEEVKVICNNTDSCERLYKGIENQLKARINDTEMAIICEMAMMYLDSLKDKETADKEAYNKGREEALQEVQNCESYGYEKGLNDAWELAKKLALTTSDGGFDTKTLESLYKTKNYYKVFVRMTPQEALAKLEAYEKEQAEIKVGDVVIPKAGKYRENEKGVVIGLYSKDDLLRISVIHKNKSGNIENTYYHKENLVKTGKHIDIQKILDELKEGTE